jgi:DMSO/TMAO reductase YedYZ heme-binding membrane subunit
VVAYAILLAALALVAAWWVWNGRARHRHRSRDDRIDLFHED